MSLRRRVPLGKDYPYMFARVSARKAKLLERSDYEDMSRMKPNEIANKLGECDYSDEIDELGSSYQGAELVELAVNRNLAATMAKLIDIAPGSLENVLKTYLRRYDIETFKRILRWKLNGREEDIESLMMPVSSFNYNELESLMEMSYEELVNDVSFLDSKVNYGEYMGDAEDIKEIEKVMDEAYFNEMGVLAENVGSRQFSDFVKYEMENQQIMKLLRLKKSEASEGEIEDELASDRTALVEKLMKSENYDEAVGKLVEEGKIEQEDSIEEIEQSLKVERLQKSLKMLHTEPLGITSILGYVVAKIIEAENIKVLVQARDSGAGPEETLENLVISE